MALTPCAYKQNFNLFSYNLTREELLLLTKKIDQEIPFIYCHYYVGESYFSADKTENIFSAPDIPAVIHHLSLYFESKDGEERVTLDFSNFGCYAAIGGENEEWVKIFFSKLQKLLKPYENSYYYWYSFLYTLELEAKPLLLYIKYILLYLFITEIVVCHNYNKWILAPILIILFGAAQFSINRFPVSLKLKNQHPFCNFLTKPDQFFFPGQKQFPSYIALGSLILFASFLGVSFLTMYILLKNGINEALKIMRRVIGS